MRVARLVDIMIKSAVTGGDMLKQSVFLVVTIVLVAVVVTLIGFNVSLRGDVEALTDALSRPSQTEERLKAENDDLNRQLLELQTEVDRLKARAEPLERLAVNHTAKITALVNEINALKAAAETANPASSDVVESTTVNPQTDSASESDKRGGVNHVLQPGETLQQLARRYYNDQTAWRRILEANRDVVKNTRSMLTGITLFIPDLD